MNEQSPAPQLSVIIPVYNEEDNLLPLQADLRPALEATGLSYEIIYCDDGSRDGSPRVLEDIARNHPGIQALMLRRNFGQTAAIAAGIDHARGNVLILMDADLQNDPRDIPKLLKKLDEGYDIVSGWRKNRKDPFLSKRLPSRIANWIISWITGVHLHDHGCTLKAYRREVLDRVSLYGEMHRFLTVLGHWMGARIAEVEVTHHPRLRGKSKYSLNRIIKVLLDLPLLVLLGNFLTRPSHFFGGIGMLFHLAAAVCALDVAYEKFFEGDKASNNPFLLLAVFFALVGIQIIMIGLLAEMMTRVYHESQRKKTYVIREIIHSKPE
ncbi:MAG: glycosyltransferase family 2 protein [bacterium]